jgi:hypothetical protein
MIIQVERNPLIDLPAAIFAALASVRWIIERLRNINTRVDTIVNAAAQHAPAIAVTLFLIGLICCLSTTRDLRRVLRIKHST